VDQLVDVFVLEVGVVDALEFIAGERD